MTVPEGGGLSSNAEYYWIAGEVTYIPKYQRLHKEAQTEYDTMQVLCEKYNGMV